jgi:hypothetical protein
MNIKLHRAKTAVLRSKGAWTPGVLAEDARRLAEFCERREGVPWEEIKAWMESWGTAQEISPPKVRKL